MRLMLVDDDRGCLEGLASAMEPSGHRLELFMSPGQAVDHYSGGDYDVVITDIKMPELDGIQLLKKIKTLDDDARVIVMTGYADLETAVAALNNGAYAFLYKPVNIAELLETIEKISAEIENRERMEKERDDETIEYTKLKKFYADLLQLLKIK
ncbi:response regulator [Desulforamulus ruminis]|uniref:Stage 0 sporulation protein A homolog n=1 Tax=Desulforamulus ruminis (strain ATCC 23193 / DSM 2154 / NCIMB 8452 / DL) TaxID=696281 RepID=F6DUF0_DESRL|nr:response regulator [Desulforamulus ruminis]AEG61335.1 response regulator receiver [Desulforamulus ruminis DSM 2154]